MKLNVLVTGGSGFIGSHFVREAKAAGHNVDVLNRPDPAQTGDESSRIRTALKGKDVLYHLAWDSNPVAGWRNPLVEVEANLQNSIRLFEACVDQGVKKVVFASSGGTIYGPQKGVITEDMIPRPFNPYGIGKLTTEHFLNYYGQRTGLVSDVYRIGNVYGPGQRTDRLQGVIALWMKHILERGKIDVYGGASTIRDYIHVSDMAQLLMHSVDDLDHGDVYNLGVGKGTSILEMLELFQGAIDVPFEYEMHERRGLDNTSCILNTDRLLAFFPGFEFRKLEDEIGPTWVAFQASAR